jgi:zinc transport system substrate-binding protein
MQQADLILLNGAAYEKWLPLVTLPESRTVDTSAAFTERLIRQEGGVSHQHGPQGEHTHDDLAFTTWLDFALAAEHAEAVANALADLMPEKSSVIDSNLSTLREDLIMLDQQLASWAKDLAREPVLGSHPVYQYLARRYDLNLRSLHWEPDELPENASWDNLGNLVEEHPARLMLWENTPAGETVTRLRQMKIESIVFSPCATTPPDGDFLEIMNRQVESLRQ